MKDETYFPTSTSLTTAAMTSAARAALGIYCRRGVNTITAMITKIPEIIELSGVFDPAISLTAVLEKPPVEGIARKKELIMFEAPKALSS